MYRVQQTVSHLLCPPTDPTCSSTSSSYLGRKDPDMSYATQLADYVATNKASIERVVAGSPYVQGIIMAGTLVLTGLVVYAMYWMKSKLT